MSSTAPEGSTGEHQADGAEQRGVLCWVLEHVGCAAGARHELFVVRASSTCPGNPGHQSKWKVTVPSMAGQTVQELTKQCRHMMDWVQLFWRVYTLVKHNGNLVRAMIS